LDIYLPIAILGLLGIVISAGIFVVSTLLGPRNPTAIKMSTYECGVPIEGNARSPFKTQFYLVAVLFLLFDVEAAFFFPWALVYKESLKVDGTLFLAFAIYLSFVVLGLIYIFKKDCIRFNQ
jgi:NADH-quinone oxidoreductase subunit A